MASRDRRRREAAAARSAGRPSAARPWAGAAILLAYLRARRRLRWSAGQLARHQLAGLRRLPGLADIAIVEEGLARLPLVTAPDFEREFASRNVLGLSLDAARSCARREQSGGRSPHRGYSFGLSTGSTGEPGVFITTAAERAQWVGTILGKLFSPGRLLRRGGLDVALLLKHDSRLYGEVTTTGRVRLHYFDIARPLAEWAASVAAMAPEVLVGPPSVLVALAAALAAEGGAIRPELLLAGAEPLFPRHREELARAYGVAPRGLYQAKEGFLATGCAHGRLHLNEDLVLFEVQRFPTDPMRMVPVITDFTRRSQSYWRHRVDDVLLADSSACPCGNPFIAILAVEGRLADVFVRRDGSPIFPLELDAALRRHLAPSCSYTLLQHDFDVFTLAIDAPVPAALRDELMTLLARAQTSPNDGRPLRLDVAPYTAPLPGEKRRPLQRLFDPRSELLTAALGPPRPLRRGSSPPADNGARRPASA